jgi:hypothetical protein
LNFIWKRNIDSAITIPSRTGMTYETDGRKSTASQIADRDGFAQDLTVA